MFKAFGRLGSHVRSLNIPLISSLFNKSRPYGGLDDDDTDNFFDAKEELDSDTESESGDSIREQDGATVACIEQISNRQSEHAFKELKVNSVSKDDETCTPQTEALTKSLEDRNIDSDQPDDGPDVDTEDDNTDEHNHKDTKGIVRTSKSSADLGRSASTSTFQRVHRRINSYTQRQYAKLDSGNVDLDTSHNDHVTQTSGSDQTDDANVFHSIDDVKNSGATKKPKRRKKVALLSYIRSFFRFPPRDSSRARMN